MIFFTFTVCFLLRPLFTLNEISEKYPIISHTPDMYIVSICCRLSSKNTKDRLFLHMVYLSVMFTEKVLLL